MRWLPAIDIRSLDAARSNAPVVNAPGKWLAGQIRGWGVCWDRFDRSCRSRKERAAGAPSIIQTTDTIESVADKLLVLPLACVWAAGATEQNDCVPCADR